jgi:hypothetical protein
MKPSKRKPQQAEKAGRELGEWMRDVRLPQLEAEHAVQGSDVAITLTSAERKRLGKLLIALRDLHPSAPAIQTDLRHWIDALIPEED